MPYDKYFELHKEIRKVGGKLFRERDMNLRRLNLTSNQSTTMLYLEVNPGCQIASLRDCLEISHQAARTMVERLKSKGLLDMVVFNSDGRAKNTNLTDEGKRMCAEIRRMGVDTASHSLSSLAPEERSQLLVLL